MSSSSQNSRMLLMSIFEAWRKDSAPDAEESVAFEMFSSELTMRPYGLAFDEIRAGIVGGGQDGGVDSVYVFFDDFLLDEDSEIFSPSARPSDFGQERTLELWVIQAKRSPGFEEEAIGRLENTLRRLLDLSVPLSEWEKLYDSSVIERFRLFRDAWEKILTRRPKVQVNVIYATPGDSSNVTPQMLIKISELEGVVRSAVSGSGGASVGLLGASELLERYNEIPSYTISLNYKEVATSGESHVALVNIRDYYNFIVNEKGRLRKHLFEWNVRDYQGPVTVNQEIKKSLTDAGSPEFWWMNNGVTILCKSATSVGKVLSLSDIQIVNGLQTSHEIYEALKDNEDPLMENRMLLVRIIVTSDPATRDKVIKATNRQTSVADAALRATDGVQRNIENYFLTKGWYYDRRKNFYKNEGKDPSKIIGIPTLGAAVTAMGLARPDKARGKPSSLLKNDDDYKQVFNEKIALETYFWAARLQRQVDDFLMSDRVEATVPQKKNLKFHLSMLIVKRLNGQPVRNPMQLRNLAQSNAAISNEEIGQIFEELKSWSIEYLQRNGGILERATKAQKFSEFLLNK